jgi:hypothetical protein
MVKTRDGGRASMATEEKIFISHVSVDANSPTSCATLWYSAGSRGTESSTPRRGRLVSLLGPTCALASVVSCRRPD